jgi:hypothetical protein
MDPTTRERVRIVAQSAAEGVLGTILAIVVILLAGGR